MLRKFKGKKKNKPKQLGCRVWLVNGAPRSTPDLDLPQRPCLFYSTRRLSELQLASRRPFLGLGLARRSMTVEVEMFGEYRERIRELKQLGLKAWFFPGK